MSKYYEAYDDRYRQVHQENLNWFEDQPSPIIDEVICRFGLLPNSKVLEIGCGEGRDARNLLRLGFDLLATDISSEAVAYCRKQDPEHEWNYRILDCLKDRLADRFDFIYAVAVVCSQGDGELECSSDIATAFSLQERTHTQSGRVMQIAGTSYRAVSFDTFKNEIQRNGLRILEMGLTDITPIYWKTMYAVVKRA